MAAFLDRLWGSDRSNPAADERGRASPCLTAHALLLLTLACLAAQAWAQGTPVVLDHVVAVINGSVILQSDVNEEMAYAVLQPFSMPSDTPQKALQRLIDRALILQQMQTAQTIDPPSAEELQESLFQVRSLIPECALYKCKTENGWQDYLHAKGLDDKEVVTRWTQRLLLLSFIQSRFGAGVRITAADIAAYYDKNLVPQFAAKTVPPPTLTAVSGRIREILLQQRVSSLLLDWLESLKSEGSVSILDAAYGKVGTTGSGDSPGGQD